MIFVVMSVKSWKFLFPKCHNRHLNWIGHLQVWCPMIIMSVENVWTWPFLRWYPSPLWIRARQSNSSMTSLCRALPASMESSHSRLELSGWRSLLVGAAQVYHMGGFLKWGKKPSQSSIFKNGIFHEIHHSSILGYLHDYGEPSISLFITINHHSTSLNLHISVYGTPHIWILVTTRKKLLPRESEKHRPRRGQTSARPSAKLERRATGWPTYSAPCGAMIPGIIWGIWRWDFTNKTLLV